MVAAGFVGLSSFAGEPASGAGVAIGGADASIFGGAALGWISAAGPFEGLVSGNEIFGVGSGACLAAAPSSACFALASARSQFTCWSKFKVTRPSARSGTTLTVPGIVKT